jgi:hypothetical protein
MIRFTSNCGAVLALMCALVACGHSFHEQFVTPNLCRADLLTVKAIEASSFESGLLPELAVDGDPRTRWASLNFRSPNTQHVIVDLGELRYVDYITLDWERAFSLQHDVWIAGEDRTWVYLKQVNISSAGKDHIVLREQLQYIKIVSNEGDPNYGISLWEFQVFGHHNPDCCQYARFSVRNDGTPDYCTPGPPRRTICGNDVIIAVGAAASSQEHDHKGAERAIDGDYSETRWASAIQEDGAWISIDLDTSTLIDSLSIYWERAYATDYALKIRNSPTEAWTLIKDVHSTGGLDIHDSLNIIASQVKVETHNRAIDQYGTSLYEIEVRGTQDPDCINPCEVAWLSLTDAELYDRATSGPIGDYCYVEEGDGSGACDYYTKGRPRPNYGDGVPMNRDLTGTGCVLGGRSTFCYPNRLDYLTQDEKDAMCTTGAQNWIPNAAAQIRWAIKNGWCMDVGVPITC